MHFKKPKQTHEIMLKNLRIPYPIEKIRNLISVSFLSSKLKLDEGVVGFFKLSPLFSSI